MTGGQNVHAAEVEEIILKFPGVADCAVFGLPDASGVSASRDWSSRRTMPASRRRSSKSFADNTSPASRRQKNSLSKRTLCRAHRLARFRNFSWSSGSIVAVDAVGGDLSPTAIIDWIRSIRTGNRRFAIELGGRRIIGRGYRQQICRPADTRPRKKASRKEGHKKEGIVSAAGKTRSKGEACRAGQPVASNRVLRIAAGQASRRRASAPLPRPLSCRAALPG